MLGYVYRIEHLVNGVIVESARPSIARKAPALKEARAFALRKLAGVRRCNSDERDIVRLRNATTDIVAASWRRAGRGKVSRV